MTNSGQFHCDSHLMIENCLSNLDKTNDKQWEELKTQGTRITSILTRINVILGGLVVAIIMLLVKILFPSV